MKFLSLLFLVTSINLPFTNAQSTKHKNDYFFFTGTYTKKTSEGIYGFTFNTATGELKNSSVTKGIKNPSFIDISPNKQFLYAVSEQNEIGTVASFKINPETGSLTAVNSQISGGNGPCYVSVDHTGKWILVSNYGGGSLALFPVAADGSIGKLKKLIHYPGSSINKERQEKSHIHSANFSPDNKDVFVTDLGTDKIYSYRFDPVKGIFSDSSFIESSPGSGPRHLTFHPNGNYAYVINELSSSITVYNYRNHSLNEFQTVSALPESYHGKKWSADIHISSDGKYLYASNRAHESIITYKIDAHNGSLSLVNIQEAGGKTPRNFALDPTGKFIIIANQDSDYIIVFSRDPVTGKILNTGISAKISMPVCIKFLPK